VLSVYLTSSARDAAGSNEFVDRFDGGKKITARISMYIVRGLFKPRQEGFFLRL
jgi:hypothetical protein